jgi:hypothetical protein
MIAMINNSLSCCIIVIARDGMFILFEGASGG